MKDLIVYLVFCTTIYSCYYDVEDDLRTDQNCVTAEITYAQDIATILSNRCYKCHGASLNLGNVTLEGYNKVRIYIDNGRLLGAIKRETGFSPMPQNETMLPDCDIMKIQAWVDSGAPNN